MADVYGVFSFFSEFPGWKFNLPVTKGGQRFLLLLESLLCERGLMFVAGDFKIFYLACLLSFARHMSVGLPIWKKV